MGSRDDNLLDDERADRAMRRVLAQIGQPLPVEPPPDLVGRSARHLPAGTPAEALHSARGASGWIALAVSGGMIMLLAALLGLMDVLGAGPQLAWLVGDGTDGLSRLLLMLRLLAKPILGSIMALMPTMLPLALLGLAGGWLWWRMLRNTPVYAGEVQR